MGIPNQTPLESAVLTLFHELYGDRGFPSPVSIQVRRRDNTGAGRYVELECPGQMDIADGYLDLAGRYIEMKSLPNGMMAVVQIKNHRIHVLEFTVYGGDSWDGTEADWALV
jgi:hypothetical protein